MHAHPNNTPDISVTVLSCQYLHLCYSTIHAPANNTIDTGFNKLSCQLPGHQPEMPDSVKLLLRDATYLGFHTDCLLKSID